MALAAALGIDYEAWFGPLRLPEFVSVLDGLEDLADGLDPLPGTDPYPLPGTRTGGPVPVGRG